MSATRPLTLGAVWLVLPVVGAIIAATLEPIPPHDYWWHLAMGRIIASGTLPDANLFLYTLPVDAPFTNQPWLGQSLMWVAYRVGGYGGTIILRNVLLALAFGLLGLIAFRRSADARAAGGLGLLAAVLAYPVLTVRTRMFAFLPFAVVLWVCLEVLDGRLRRRWLVVAPLATVFWANTHGSFVLSAAIVSAVGLGALVQGALDARRIDLAALRDWGATLAAVVLAAAASPLGFGAYGYVYRLTMDSSVARSVTEWLPPDVSILGGQIFLAAVLVSIGVLFVRRRHVSLSDAFLFAGTLFLAAGAVRSAFWWAAVLPVVLAPHVSALLPERQEEVPTRAEGVVLRLGLAGLLMAVVFVQPGVGREFIGETVQSAQARLAGDGAYLLNHENAESALKQIRADGRSRVFHDQALGGMLEFWLTEVPAQVAFVDQRMEFVPDDVWDRYFALSRAQTHWDRELTRLGVDTLLLAPESQSPLLQAALASPDWELVGLEQSHLLLYRRPSLDGVQHPAK